MDNEISAGIDMGNLVTRASVFQPNEADMLRSKPMELSDRNGQKNPP